MIVPSDSLFEPMVALLCVMLALLLPAALVSIRLGRHLRVHHPSVWHDLGEPGFRNLTVATSGRSARFIRAGEYRKLGDPIVDRLATKIKVVGIANLLCFAAFLLLFGFETVS